MRSRVALLFPIAGLLAGCGLLLGTSDDPYVDPALSIPPGSDGGEAGNVDETGADAGNDAEIEADIEDAGEDVAVDPDI